MGCGGAGEEWWMAVAGARALVPEKDSILALTADGTWAPARVVRRSPADPASCPTLPGFEAERWVVDPPMEALELARYYEPTGYRFSDEALRMRNGGRWQPLTDLLFDDGRSSILWGPGRRMRALIRTLSRFGAGRERSWEIGAPP